MRSHMAEKAVQGSAGRDVSNPTTIYCDNLMSIQLAKNPVFHARTKHIEVHYHFVCERVLSSEVELVYVPTYRQTADIFTKPLGLDKLRQFSGALGLRHLDVSNLERGRKTTKGSRSDRAAESDDDFDFGSTEEAEGGSAEEAESGHGGSNRRENPKSAEQGGDEAKKDEEAKTKSWSDVVKGLKTEDELETTNSDEGRNDSRTADLVQTFDSEMPNRLKAKQKKGQRKRRQYLDNKGAEKGRTSRQANRKGGGTRNQTGPVARARREARSFE